MPILFSVLVNDLDVGLEDILSKFSDDTKLGGSVDSNQAERPFREILTKLRAESFVITSNMNFNKSKFWILQLG